MSKSAVGILLAAVLIVVAPMALLVIFPHATFNRDWDNNLWMVAYERAYLNNHLTFPDTFDIDGHVGMVQPVFYGPILYPCLAVLSEPFGPNIGIRIACVGIWTLQFGLAFGLIRKLKASPWEALAGGAILSWSIYPLTNLYNRGALAEFLATGLLTCALLAGGLALFETMARRRAGFVLLAGLCAAIAMGSHAPTAFVGGLLLFLFAASSLAIRVGDQAISLRRSIGITLLVFAAIAAVISPWAYALAQTHGQLTIEVPYNPFYPMAGRWSTYGTLDRWWVRLQPLPWGDHNQSFEKSLPSDTPYLDTQWNFPIAMLAAWNAALALRFRRRRRGIWPVLLGAAAAGIGLLVISICAPLQNALPMRFGAAVQFPFRLVSHVNIALFVVLLAALAARANEQLPARTGLANRIVLAIAVLISAVGLVMKLDHAHSTMTPAGVTTEEQSAGYLTKLPAVYVGGIDYTLQVPDRVVPSGTVRQNEILNIPGAGPSAPVATVRGQIPDDRWVVTSILNFPWNRLVLDGRPLPFDQTYNHSFREAVYVAAGVHSFGYQFEPDPKWVVLRSISWLVLDGGVVAMAAIFLRESPRPPR